MKKLIILRGIPGSGKTTHARELMQYYINENATVTHFEADMFFTKSDGTYDWKPPVMLTQCTQAIWGLAILSRSQEQPTPGSEGEEVGKSFSCAISSSGAPGPGVWRLEPWEQVSILPATWVYPTGSR